MLKRTAQKTLMRFLDVFSVVGLTGPRQSGKTTLLQEALPTYTYISFDDIQFVDQFNADPKGFMKSYPDRVIFDEVQFVPRLFNEVKIAVDQDRQKMGKYILTGSSQFSYIQNISESLAGRIGLMTLLPLQYIEIPEPLRETAVYAGSYPELVTRSYQESRLWYGAYLETYLLKDVRTLSQVGDLRDFSRFVHLLATRVSQVLDMSNIARECGISLPTVKRWISILEASYIVFLLPAYHGNLSKRMVKRPKLYFYDTGLVSYLTGIQNQELYEKGPMAGALFENYVIGEIIKKHKHLAIQAKTYFYRSADGVEIDLIIDEGHTQTFIEIKKSHTYNPKMTKQLKHCMNESQQGILLYQGQDFPTQHNIRIMHYQDYLK